MTYYMRGLLQKVGEGFDDPEQQAAFRSVIEAHQFSSDRPNAVTYEGVFQRDLEAAGLQDLIGPLTLGYREQVLNYSGLTND